MEEVTIGKARILHGDCLTFMRELPDKFYDLACPAKSFRMARCEAYVGVNKIHPTQKPVRLYEFCFSNYAKQGDKIFDSHGGSMSSVIAALNLGFEITCLELDSDYFKAGVARVRQSQQQTRMFEPEVVMPKQASML